MGIIAVDSETTGIDFYHGARPFLVTVCSEQGEVTYWEWDVEPATRNVVVPEQDIEELKQLLLYSGHELVLQNAKFDVAALATLCPSFSDEWPWERTNDTLLAAHLLASNKPKDLTSLGIMYLGVDITRHEEALKVAVQDARKEATRQNKSSGGQVELWAIAKAGRDDMPSAGEDTWRFDQWLPRAMAQHMGVASTHPWWDVVKGYANTDSALTAAIWPVMKEEMERRKLMDIFNERMKALPVAHDMERRGVTVDSGRMGEIYNIYQDDSRRAGAKCQNIADTFNHSVLCGECLKRIKNDTKRSREGKGIPKNRKPCKECGATRDEQVKYAPRSQPFKLEMPAGAAVNNSLRTFAFDVLKLPPVHSTKAKSEAPTLNKAAIAYYLNELPRNGKAFAFVRALAGKRSRDTALAYMTSYQRFWVPLGGSCFLLHPSLNPTGTDTLRWSSSQPNEQNISKQGMRCLMCLGAGCSYCNGEGVDGRNVRYCFGPPPGYEWWSLDAKNIELRIPAYASKEQELIALFESPDVPPYYGSTHLLNFHTVYPDIWDPVLAEVGLEKVGPACKKRFASTYYQWCKNGGFAVQYGAVERADGWGTADKAFHKKGAHAQLKARFSKLEQLNQRCIKYAEKYGYVETMPDKSVDPHRGYPLLCTRTDYGQILPTVPLNYYVQGTAMWWTMRGMIRTKPVLDEWTEQKRRRYGAAGLAYRIVMQVHDEMVFEMPARADPKKNPKASNLGKAKELARLMAMGGDDIGVPTPVGIEHHVENWCEGITLA